MIVQRYFLPRSVHLCLTGDGAVFLDLKRDKYLGINAAQARALRAIMEGTPIEDPDAAELARTLMSQRLLTPDRTTGKELAPTAVSSADVLLVDADLDAWPEIRVGHVMSLFLAYVTVALALRGGSLEFAVRRAHLRRTRALNRSPAFDIEAARLLLRVFRNLRPAFYAARRNCLLDSLVLVEFLATYELFPSLVFGVKTVPFKAHCWVQHDHFAFNGSPAVIGTYQPIMIV